MLAKNCEVTNTITQFCFQVVYMRRIRLRFKPRPSWEKSINLKSHYTATKFSVDKIDITLRKILSSLMVQHESDQILPRNKMQLYENFPIKKTEKSNNQYQPDIL